MLKTFGAIAIVSVALTGPAMAQYGFMRDSGYYGPVYGYGPAYGPGPFRGAYIYNRVPMGLPFYGDGWVPESIWDHSRVGGVDPTIRPSN
jgi:hypothetical protein